MAQEIYRIVPRVLMEIFADVFHARLFYMGDGVRVGAGEGLFLVGIATGHEHVTAYTRLNAGQDRAYVRVPTVADESNAMAINARPESRSTPRRRSITWCAEASLCCFTASIVLSLASTHPLRACGASISSETTPERASTTASSRNSSLLASGESFISQCAQRTAGNGPLPGGISR